MQRRFFGLLVIATLITSMFVTTASASPVVVRYPDNSQDWPTASDMGPATLNTSSPLCRLKQAADGSITLRAIALGRRSTTCTASYTMAVDPSRLTKYNYDSAFSYINVDYSLNHGSATVTHTLDIYGCSSAKAAPLSGQGSVELSTAITPCTVPANRAGIGLTVELTATGRPSALQINPHNAYMGWFFHCEAPPGSGCL